MCPLSRRADSTDRMDKFHVSRTSVRSVPRLSGCCGRFGQGVLATAAMRSPAAACNEAQLDDCIEWSRRSSARPRQHGSMASDKRDPRGRLLFTFLADLSGLGQTSSPQPPTLVVRQPQSPKLSAHCTCRGARLWSARVATFLLTRLPANLSSLISAFVTEGSRRFRKYVRR